MREKEQGVIEQYDLTFMGSRKGRGVMIYEAEDTLYVLKTVKGSPARVMAQAKLLEKLKSGEDFFVERYIPNKEGAYITKNEDGEQFLLKEYLDGREWNLEDESEILRGSRILGTLHKRLCIPGEAAFPAPAAWSKEVDKHNRELKRTRNFIRERQKKTRFELLFLELFHTFYTEAEEVREKLKTFDEESLIQRAAETGSLCHGEFTYHNLIHCRGGVAILNFDKMYYGVQMDDFYQYFRKIMEKNNWKESLAKKVLEAYGDSRGISRQEAEYLYLRFAYPDKFWKIANHYFNGSKNRLIEKGQDKLESVRLQNEKRREFLAFLEVWYKMC